MFKSGKGAKAQPPSDIQGLQRLQYQKLDGFSDDCLTSQLNHRLVRKLTHPRHVYDQLSGSARDKAFVVAMRILAHFKGYKVIHRQNLTPLPRGSYLRKAVVDDVLAVLRNRGLIKGKAAGPQGRAGRSLYKGVTF